MNFTVCPLGKWLRVFDVRLVTLKFDEESALPDFIFTVICWLRNAKVPLDLSAISVDSFVRHLEYVRDCCKHKPLPWLARVTIYLGLQPGVAAHRRAGIMDLLDVSVAKLNQLGLAVLASDECKVVKNPFLKVLCHSPPFACFTPQTTKPLD
jgi:hypothetical protein